MLLINARLRHTGQSALPPSRGSAAQKLREPSFAEAAEKKSEDMRSLVTVFANGTLILQQDCGAAALRCKAAPELEAQVCPPPSCT